MARRRVYIMPFNPNTNPNSTYGSWIEVTKDVGQSGLGAIQQKLDVSDYDVGVYTNSAIALSLVNNQGKYSDVDVQGTIFALKRSDSQVKITWDISDWDFFAGLSSTGELVGQEVIVFQGLLNDDSTVMQLDNQLIDFNVLGYESILDRVAAPDWVGTPPADNKASTLMKALLQAANAGVTATVLTIDNSRVVPANDVVWDDLTVFANKTCREAFNILLQGSNSVLYMDLTTPVVSSRAATGSSLKTFYGPGSSLGPENIIDIKDIRTGLNRTFNFVTWKDTTLLSTDGASSTKYGVRKKDLSVDGITDGTKRQGIIDAIRTEFAFPKQEFTLTCPIDYDVLALPLLGQVSIDFPIVPVQVEGNPIYGVSQYGVAQYPTDISSFLILLTEPYKIIGMSVDLVANNVELNLRRI